MEDYKFSMDFWNECHIANFDKIASILKNCYNYPRVLEIGTFEGRTATWILENIPNATLTIVEPDPGPNFHHNLGRWFETGRLSLVDDYSYNALVGLRGNRYDLIYIDGDHNACGVLEDAVLAWRLLSTGGILLFDDYEMEIRDPWFYISHREFETARHNGCMWIHPREAINTFLNLYKGQYEMYIDNYQIGIKKFCEIGKKNLNHGDNSQEAIYEQNKRTD